MKLLILLMILAGSTAQAHSLKTERAIETCESKIRAVVSSEDFPAASEVCQYTPDIIINCKDTACIKAEAYVPEP